MKSYRFNTSHASVQGSIIPSEILVKVKLGSFLLRHLRLLWLFFGLLIMLLFFLLRIIALILFILFIILFILLLFAILILFTDSQLFLNFLNQDGNFFFGYLVLLQNMRVFLVQLFGDFHRIWIKDQTLQHYRVYFFLFVSLFIFVVDADDWGLVAHAEA